MQKLLITLLLLLAGQTAWAWSLEAIVDPAFERLRQGQQVELQKTLESIFTESEGYQITGPLDPDFNLDSTLLPLYRAVRIICPDLESYETAKNRLEQAPLAVDSIFLDAEGLSAAATGWRGHRAWINWQGESLPVCINSIGQTRFLIWMKEAREQGWVAYDVNQRHSYAEAVANYLAATDSGRVEAVPPPAADYGLAADLDLYAPIPPYVIEGYQNYKDYLAKYRALQIDFAHGIIAFVPDEELLARLIAEAPREAFPNKEIARLQDEYREFAERGGDLRVMQTLTAVGFDTLKTGEYFFAVSPSGKIRFGRELLREEVERVETETGHKAPRANHALLFPGEALLTAGAFFIDLDAESKLTEITAGSGHYFYSNIQETIYDDVARRSNYYVLSLGHFLTALAELGIDHDEILIRKF